MKKVFAILVLVSSFCTYAGSKNKTRWPAQESPQISRNIIQCDFPKNNLEIESLEIFASTTSKESLIIFSNISSIVGITAHGGFKALSSGGDLAISESKEITGKVTLAGNSATFNFVKGVGTVNLGGAEIKASSCTSFLK